jgi:hypothetical protein
LFNRLCRAAGGARPGFFDRRPRPAFAEQASISVATLEAAVISTAQAAAAPISPASSRFRMAIDATLVSGEYRNTTAEMVVIALMKK